MCPLCRGLAKDELYLPDGHIGKEVTALNCPKCRIILISYENYPYDHPIFHKDDKA